MNINLLKTNKVFIIIIFLIFYVTGCRQLYDFIFNFSELSEYPTIIYPLSPEELKNMKDEFHKNNPKICSTLNEYGFTCSKSMCYKGEGFDQNNYEYVKLINLAKSSLLKNSKYTNIADTSLLEILDSRASKYNLRISFKDQIYEGFRVVSSSKFFVLLDSINVFSINGNWYNNIFIPTSYNINESRAKNIIIGEEVIWYDAMGEPRVFRVTRASMNNSAEQVILPLERDQTIELRISWQIPISFGESFIGWHFYVDTMTGELLKIVQLFVT